MPIPPSKRTGAEAVIAVMIERLQLSRDDIMAFLEVGKALDLADRVEVDPPTRCEREKRHRELAGGQ